MDSTLSVSPKEEIGRKRVVPDEKTVVRDECGCNPSSLQVLPQTRQLRILAHLLITLGTLESMAKRSKLQRAQTAAIIKPKAQLARSKARGSAPKSHSTPKTSTDLYAKSVSDLDLQRSRYTKEHRKLKRSQDSNIKIKRQLQDTQHDLRNANQQNEAVTEQLAETQSKLAQYQTRNKALIKKNNMLRMRDTRARESKENAVEKP